MMTAFFCFCFCLCERESVCVIMIWGAKGANPGFECVSACVYGLMRVSVRSNAKKTKQTTNDYCSYCVFCGSIIRGLHQI